MRGIEKTIDYFGSMAAVARALQLSGYQVVQDWRRNGRVPAEHCPKIEALTHGKVLCEELNDRVDWAVVRNSKTSQPTAEH